MRNVEALRSFQLDPAQIEYLAGFFDVSGSITIERNRDYRVKEETRYDYPLRVELQRVRAEAIALFRSLIPGPDKDRLLPSGKTADRWYVKARKARLLLEILGPNLRLKAGHWQTVQEYTDTFGGRPAEDSEKLKKQIEELN